MSSRSPGTAAPGEARRWHELALDRRGHEWTAAVVFRSEQDGEADFAWARRGTAAEVARWLLPATGECPMPPWHVGYPPGSRSHARRQGRLLEDIRSRYREAATGLLALHIEFAEHLP